MIPCFAEIGLQNWTTCRFELREREVVCSFQKRRKISFVLKMEKQKIKLPNRRSQSQVSILFNFSVLLNVLASKNISFASSISSHLHAVKTTDYSMPNFLRRGFPPKNCEWHGILSLTDFILRKIKHKVKM